MKKILSFVLVILASFFLYDAHAQTVVCNVPQNKCLDEGGVHQNDTHCSSGFSCLYGFRTPPASQFTTKMETSVPLDKIDTETDIIFYITSRGFGTYLFYVGSNQLYKQFTVDVNGCREGPGSNLYYSFVCSVTDKSAQEWSMSVGRKRITEPGKYQILLNPNRVIDTTFTVTKASPPPTPTPPPGPCQGGFCDTALGEIATNPTGFITRIFGILLSLAGGIALLLIIVSGYRLMTSQGNPEKVQAAREQLTSAIVGLLFIIFSLSILTIIGVDILRIPGFGGETK